MKRKKQVKSKKQKVQETISIRDNYSRGELAKEILKGLAVGGLIVASFAMPNLPKIFYLFGVESAKDRYKIKRSLYGLSKRKLVIMYDKDGEEYVEITEEGKKRILKYKLDEICLTRPRKWDKRWRIITFDIPETHKRARDGLTGKLNEMEIYALQKSVFICPFECRDEIDFVSEYFGIRKFVHYFVANEIDDKDEDYLKAYYNLK